MNNKLISDQRGISNALAIPLIGAGILALGLLGASIYLFTELDSAKNERDEFAQSAIADAKEAYQVELQEQFDQKEKEPFLDFDGPDLLGGITFKYPKTWSVMLEQNESGRDQLNGYFHPVIIRFDNESDRSYALRLELLDSAYNRELNRFQTAIKKGEIKSKTVVFNGVEGVRLDGQLDDEDRGSMVVLPLRDKTIRIWTESPEFVEDFDTVLETFTFNP